MLARIGLVLAAVTVSLTLAACGSGDNGDGGAEVAVGDLDGRYISTSIEGGDLSKDTEVALVFDPDGSPQGAGVSATVGCNTIGGSFSLEGGRFIAKNLFSTQMGCPPEQAKAEAWLVKMLESTPELTLEEGKLEMSGPEGTLHMEEAAAAQPPTVEGTEWELNGIGTGQSIASVPVGVRPPTLEFENGRVVVFGGCNTGRGEARVSNDGFIHFGPIAMTRKSCGAEADRVEKQVMDLLKGKVAHAWSGSNLVLSRSGDSLTFVSDE